jgi:hypothetical protein
MPKRREQCLPTIVVSILQPECETKTIRISSTRKKRRRGERENDPTVVFEINKRKWAGFSSNTNLSNFFPTTKSKVKKSLLKAIAIDEAPSLFSREYFFSLFFLFQVLLISVELI